MFFKRKTKNRRLGRDYVLDVKLRSSQVRAARVRMAAVGVSAIFVTVFCVYVLWRTGDWALNLMVYENKDFAIQDVDIQTDGDISVQQLRRWSGVKVGENLLALDLARVKRDLEMIPLVATASVERILPGTVRIRITEREPVAQVNLTKPRVSGGVELMPFHLVAGEWVSPPLEPKQRPTPPPQPVQQLPVLYGVNPGEIQPGRRIEAPHVQSALQLLMAFEQSSMAGIVDLRRIDVSAPEVLVVTTDQPSEITFGLTDPALQLSRWRE